MERLLRTAINRGGARWGAKNVGRNDLFPSSRFLSENAIFAYRSRAHACSSRHVNFIKSSGMALQSYMDRDGVSISRADSVDLYLNRGTSIIIKRKEEETTGRINIKFFMDDDLPFPAYVSARR